MRAMSECLDGAGHAHQVVGDPTLFEVVFTDAPVMNYRDIAGADKQKAAAFNASLRRNGILKPPVKLYLSMAHTDQDIAQTIDAVADAARAL
jgi:glutamate-1-semialdehyde 2,1-aminomutase